MIYLLQDNDLNKSSAVLRVRGPDANTYLQGQFTQDLRAAKSGPIYGLWLDQKGKVLADSHIVQAAENDFLVVSSSAPAVALMARLEAYLIADEVELSDETNRWCHLLLWGEGAAGLEVPAWAVSFSSRRASPGAREILLPSDRATAWLAGAGARFAPATRAQAELARLKAALPAVPVDIGPRDLPAEGALDEVAISYTKGCYLGQEVMARLKNLGQVRRALHLVAGAGVPPEPGTPLLQGERKAGEMRSSARDGEGFLALAMLSLVNLDPRAPLGLASGGTEIRILRRA